MALAHRPMADGLGDVALAGAAEPDDEDRHLLVDEPAGHQLLDQGRVDLGVEGEVELIEGFVEAEGGPAQAQGELFLLAAGDLIGDEQGQELGVGHLLVDGLLVAGLERVEDSRQAQLLEHGGQFWHGVHEGVSGV